MVPESLGLGPIPFWVLGDGELVGVRLKDVRRLSSLTPLRKNCVNAVMPLEEVIRSAAADAFASRSPLYEALLSSEIYMLHAEKEGSDDLNLWAESDSDLGGVWVPLFSSPESAVRYAETFETEDQLSPVLQDPKKVYALLATIPRIAGIRLDPNGDDAVGLEWCELHALSQGRVPDEGPRLYELPDGPFQMPDGLRGRFGKLEASRVGFEGRQVVFPDEAPLALEDFRRWVRLTLDDGEDAWTPCRHFAALLHRKTKQEHQPELEEEFLAALIEFEMYGDAEAFCATLVVEPCRAAYSLGKLAEVYRKSGRVEECCRLCEEALLDYPEEIELYCNLALGRAELKDLEGARKIANEGLKQFPDDAILRRFV